MSIKPAEHFQIRKQLVPVSESLRAVKGSIQRDTSSWNEKNFLEGFQPAVVMEGTMGDLAKARRESWHMNRI